MLASRELPAPGEHNALNLCAALAALEAFGVAVPPLSEALVGFTPLPHRLETVAERDGVLWVNDSISTTPESTIAALASFAGREIVLIGGGQDRGQDYTGLASRLAQARASVIGLPSTGPRLIAAARQAGVPQQRAIESDDIRAAVALARGRLRRAPWSCFRPPRRAMTTSGTSSSAASCFASSPTLDAPTGARNSSHWYKRPDIRTSLLQEQPVPEKDDMECPKRAAENDEGPDRAREERSLKWLALT